MQLEVKIDLGDIYDEEGTCVQDIIKHSIDSAVAREVLKKLDLKIDDNILKKARDQFDKRIEDLTNDFISKPFDLYTKWGDKKGQAVSVIDVLREKLEEFMNEKIDSYNSKRRYTDIIERTGQAQIDKFVNQLSAKVVNDLREDINTQALDRISKAILSDVKLKKLI